MVRVRGLLGVDPRSVPLPLGTEVSATVARPGPGGGRVVPQGAVGRVLGVDGEEVRVQVVGVGEVVYPRGELIPRKMGQLRFAARRADAETKLRPCVVLEAAVGSRAWGLSEAGSDFDTRGVFLFPFPWTTGLANPPDVVVSADGNETYWELGRTVRQLLRADPNTLEMLFVPGARAVGPMRGVGERLIAERDAFVSAEIYGSFGRYALSQAKKLEQSLRLARHREMLFKWLGEDPALTLDPLSVRLAVATGDDTPAAILRAREYIKQLYRSLHDQGLIDAADLGAMARSASSASLSSGPSSEPGSLELPRELRPKNAYNLLRLVACAGHWLETGEPLIEVTGPLRDRLLSIKRGEVPLEDALRWTEREAQRLEAARVETKLPPRPDFRRAERLLRDARADAARAFVTHQPGPWGTGAPPPPEAEP